MDVSEEDYKLEETQKAEYKGVGDIVRDSVHAEGSKPVEETADGDHEKLDLLGETVPSLGFTKPVESLAEEFTQATENPVEDTLDNKIESNGVSITSKEIDSVSGQNGFSQTLDQNNEVSSVAMDSVSKGTGETILPDSDGNLVESAVADIPKSEDVRGIDADNCGEDTMAEVPHSTENQAYIAVTPRPLQRTSWTGCCGLFEVLRRSDR